MAGSDGSKPRSAGKPDPLAGAATVASRPDLALAGDTDPLARTAMSDSAPGGDARHDTDPLARTAASEPPAALADTTVGGSAPAAGRGKRPEGRAARRDRLIDELRDGARIGRFTVLDALGAGGMGVVLAAFDPKLDRRVAIKMLHDDVSELHSVRLEREAKAMAQLSHPNVVTVHEVGSFEGRLYIAMEYVDGHTLGGLLRDRPAGLDVLDLLLQAGRGLAAAHAVGLVHRDFKPDNVLVGKDGRARVSDFGLVSSAGEDSAPPGASLARSLATSSLTMTGAVMGTPLYMAPEQHAGRIADAKADQFSFCVTAWEALCGEPPHGHDTYEQLIDNVSTGRLRPVPRGVRLPAALKAILARGLSAAPEQRWPSMHELLRALERTRRRTRWPWLVAAALVLAGGGAAAVALLRDGPRDPCAGAETRLVGVWDAARRGALEAALGQTGAPAAAEVWQRVATRLDGYTTDWVAHRRATCEATHLRGEQSAELLDLRMRCLDRRLGELDALLDRFAEITDRELAIKAIDATAGLRDLADCDDLERLRERFPLPTDPARRARITALEAQLAEVESFDKLGKYDRALTLVVPIAAEAATLGYPPLEAEAVLDRAGLEKTSGDHASAEASYRLAADAAARARDDARLAKSWIDLMQVLAAQARYGDALALAPVARAAAERVSDNRPLTARFHNNLAGIHLAQGNYREAAADYARAYEVVRALGDDHPLLGHATLNMGLGRWYTGDLPGAKVMFEDALARFIRVNGPLHPTVAYARRNLGDLAAASGDDDGAIASYRAAVSVWESANGPDHVDVALGLEQLALALARKGLPDQARAAAERTLAIREAALGPDHPLVGQALSILADLDLAEPSPERLDAASAKLERMLAIAEAGAGKDHIAVVPALDKLATLTSQRGQAVQAVGLRERSLAIRLAALGPEHTDTAFSHYKLAQAQLEVGRGDDAYGNYLRAYDIWRTQPGARPDQIVEARARLGEARSAQGRHAEALAIYREALAELATQPANPDLLAVVRLGHAQALWAAGQRRAAVTLARQARAAVDNPAFQVVLDAWLAAR